MRLKSQETKSRILEAVESFYLAMGRSPSIGELVNEVGHSKSTVYRYLLEMHPENSSMQDIYPTQCAVQGIARHVIRAL